MEDIRKVAEAYYANGSESVQTLAHNFFNAMDDNGDGSISFAEFTSFMEEEGYHTKKGADWFNWFDKDNNGTLDFMEVMTVFYTIKSGRPCCSQRQCRQFIDEAYFVCIECFESSNKPCYLCTDCYGSKKWDHNHNGRRSLFMDNYGLLESLRISALSKQQGGSNTSNAQAQSQPPTSNATVQAKGGSNTSNAQTQSQPPTSNATVQAKGGSNTSNAQTQSQPPTSNAIVQAKNQNAKQWLKALEVAIALGNVGAGVAAVCTIL